MFYTIRCLLSILFHEQIRLSPPLPPLPIFEKAMPGILWYPSLRPKLKSRGIRTRWTLSVFFLQLPDAHGREPRMMLWSYAGNDVLGLVPRIEKVVSTCEQVQRC